jgi:uncharacterized protein YbaR (Trm112 family)
MPAPQAESRSFDPRLLEHLACPVCFEALQFAGSSESIACLGCRRSYPLIDGIPVLIPERARLPSRS